MCKPIFFISLACLFLPFLLPAQPINNDFRAVDSLARTIRYQNDIYKLTKDLTGSYEKQLFKARAIFAWITDNIAYDYKFVNKGKEIKGPVCKPGSDCQRIRDEWENDYLKQVLGKKKAICDGYARLFKKMCGIAGIPCEIVGGYTKTKPYQIGNTGSLDHAWNAVLIDSAWHMLDVTWAAGGCHEDEESGKLLPFTKRFNDFFWCTPFDDFTKNHYPKDPKWVLEPGYTKEKYANNPWYASEIIDQLHLHSPSTGVIKAKKGDTLHFEFDYSARVKYLQVNSNLFHNPSIWDYEKVTRRHKQPTLDTIALRRQQYIPYQKNGDTYKFDFVVTDESLYYVELLFNYKKVMRFNIKIETTVM